MIGIEQGALLFKTKFGSDECPSNQTLKSFQGATLTHLLAYDGASSYSDKDKIRYGG